MKKEHITNEEFSSLIANGRTEEVFEYIFKLYRGYIRKCASRFEYASKVELEDLESVAYLEFWNAFMLFDPRNDKNCSFPTYFTKLINRRMIKVINKQRTMSRDGMLELSLDKCLKVEDKSLTLGETILDENAKREFTETEIRILSEKLEPELTEMQKKTFCLYMQGMKECEIARTLGQCTQTVNHRLNAVRKKIGKLGVLTKEQAIS